MICIRAGIRLRCCTCQADFLVEENLKWKNSFGFENFQHSRKYHSISRTFRELFRIFSKSTPKVVRILPFLCPSLSSSSKFPPRKLWWFSQQSKADCSASRPQGLFGILARFQGWTECCRNSTDLAIYPCFSMSSRFEETPVLSVWTDQEQAEPANLGTLWTDSSTTQPSDLSKILLTILSK